MTDWKLEAKYSSASFRYFFLSVHLQHGITSNQTKKYLKKI